MKSKEFRNVIKRNVDLISVPKVMDDLYKQYEQVGVCTLKKVSSAFTYRREDGSIYMVYWDKGVIYDDEVEV
jgi:hypothetical protein